MQTRTNSKAGVLRFVDTLGKSYKLFCHEVKQLFCRFVMHVISKRELIHLNIILSHASHYVTLLLPSEDGIK